MNVGVKKKIYATLVPDFNSSVITSSQKSLQNICSAYSHSL